MKVMVTGGRQFNDIALLYGVLDALNNDNPITLLIHGNQSGADKLAQQWAWSRGVEEKPFDADWKRYGKAAGPIRNQEMINTNPDIVVAFPGGSGTQDAKDKAGKAGIYVREIWGTP